MSTLNKKFGDDLLITKKRLEETKTLVNKEIAGTNVYFMATCVSTSLVAYQASANSSFHSMK